LNYTIKLNRIANLSFKPMQVNSVGLPIFRASGIGNLMTEPKNKAAKDAGDLSESAKTHVLNTWIGWKYKRRQESYSKYLEKGISVEENAITSFSLLYNVFLTKNEKPYQNEWFCGTPDLFELAEDGSIEVVVDTKSSWDIFTFQKARTGQLNDLYYWQLQTYMALTGAKFGKVAFCLENATADLITDEKRKLAYAMRCFGDDESDAYKARCCEIERLMIYDLKSFQKHYPFFDFHSNLSEWKYDISLSDRVHVFGLNRNDDDIALMRRKVEKAWEYIKTVLDKN